MRILITGSSGRIGEAIARRVIGAHEVVGLDILPGRFTSIVATILDAAALRTSLEGVDGVVHTASLHAPHLRTHSASEFRRTNVEGTKLLLDACLARGVRRFVYTSTTSLYGSAMTPRDEAVWVTEELDPCPRDIYDETKIEGEALCRDASAGLSCVSLRVARCFPEPDERIATYRLYRGVDERDVAEAHLLSLTRETDGYSVFNIASRNLFVRQDCAALLHDAAEVIRNRIPWAEDEYARRGWRLPESIDRVYVSERARSVLGYEPRYGFDSLLRR